MPQETAGNSCLWNLSTLPGAGGKSAARRLRGPVLFLKGKNRLADKPSGCPWLQSHGLVPPSLVGVMAQPVTEVLSASRDQLTGLRAE